MISIIIPAYNVGPYLYDCLWSVLRQTYRDFEIILVVSESTDNTEGIARKHARRNPDKIRLVETPREGISVARNCGMEIARGDLIAFVDADDIVDPKYLETLWRLLHTHPDADIAQCRFRRFRDRPAMGAGRQNIRTHTGREMSFTLVNPMTFSGTVEVWNKLYRKEILAGIPFPPGKICEDCGWTWKVLYRAAKVVCTDQVLYHYRQNSGSTTGKNRHVLKTDVLELDREILGHMKARYEQGLHDQWLKRYYYDLLRYYSFCQLTLPTDDPWDAAGTYQELCQSGMLSLPERVLLNPGHLPVLPLYRAGRGCMWAWKYLPPAIPAYFEKAARSCLQLLYLKRIRELRNGWTKRIILIGTPEHANLGDHAIAIGTRRFLAHYFPDFEIVEITDRQYTACKNSIRKHIRNTDVLMITGGGFAGDLWQRNGDDIIRHVLNTYWYHKTVVLPQSVYFDQDQSGDDSAITYSRATLFCVRDKASQERLTDYGVRSVLWPDLALYLQNETLGYDREGIGLILRDDKESDLSTEERDYVVSQLAGHNIIPMDTLLPHGVSPECRELEVHEIMRQISRRKLIITDRLHAAIFARITRTPCIALDNLTGKVAGVADCCILHCPELRVVTSPKDVTPEMVEELMGTVPIFGQERVVPDEVWDNMAKQIRSVIC
jgi:pyruvyl transferase EpsI